MSSHDNYCFGYPTLSVTSLLSIIQVFAVLPRVRQEDVEHWNNEELFHVGASVPEGAD
jgi:hypothetical protein